MPDSQDEVISAAGALVWRPGAGHGPADVEVVLVHRPKYDDWSYPKGKREPGEHVLCTAVREVAEETGLRVSLGRPLPSSVYQVGAHVKQVSYWAARCVGSDGFVPGDEVDQLAWLPAAGLSARLSYRRDMTLADQFRSGPASTVPFILLRHTSAGQRLAGCTADLSRPLDDGGAADARLLAELLACYGECRVVSSPAERCLATVRPYAAAVGVPVQVEPAFTVPARRGERAAGPGAYARTAGGPGPAGSPGQAGSPGPAGPPGQAAPAGSARRTTPAGQEAGLAAQRVAELAADAVPTLICAHRENLPVLLAAARRALLGGSPSGEPLPKGAFVVLQSAGGVLVSSERHDVAG
jgi:8-oxo-dGTP diphosphatase